MTPEGFDIAVIGAGSGGLTVAAAAAQFGQRVVLFEKSEMGGDCLNTGCVPSKALIAAAARAQAMREAGRYGIKAVVPEVDFKQVMAHVRDAIATIAPHDSQERFEKLGVTVIRAAARFVGTRELEAAGQRFTARRIVVATGSRAAVPAIPGLDGVPFFTNETLFLNEVLPSHLVIIGGGPIGCELGQAFRRLGSAVTIIQSGAILAKEDPEAAGLVAERLAAEGITLKTGTAVKAVSGGAGGIRVDTADGQTITGSHLLVAAGRTANVEGLDLAAAGIDFTPRGITTDDGLKTSNRAVYAVGDVAGRGQFTHLASYHAGLVVRNALFGLPVKAKAQIPRVTFTAPELAQVGLTEPEALAAHGSGVKVLRAPFALNDKAVAEGRTDGFVKVLATARGRILGATIVGDEAGELIQPWVMALAGGVKLSRMTSYIHPYPTRGEASKRAAINHFASLASNPFLRSVIRLIRTIRP